MSRAAEALAEARRWIGTPYRHGASVLGAGCDCLGLLRGVRRALYGGDERPPPYRPDWAEVLDGEPLLDAVRTRMPEIAVETAGPGDLLLFRISPSAAVKHCAIVSAVGPGGPERMIHAYWGRAVVESWIGPWWRRRMAAAFRFSDAEAC